MCRPPPRSKLVTTSGYRCPLRPGLDARDPAPAPGGIIEFLDEGSDICEVLGLEATRLDRGIHALGQHR